VLAGTVETAVNALWDAAPLIGDRIAVVGAGMVGCSVAACWPASRAYGCSWSTSTRAAPPSPRRSASASRLPEDADGGDCDLVVHASATEAGLTRSLELLAPEGTVVELSWYGDRQVSVPLGEFFHSRRLTVRSSQVGGVAGPGRRRGYADRLALALDLLADPAFDALITGECAFDELPGVMPGSPPVSCPGCATSPAAGSARPGSRDSGRPETRLEHGPSWGRTRGRPAY
jgi:threonine dehydrogenase-like Zn-dependent dehydrogenase